MESCPQSAALGCSVLKGPGPETRQIYPKDNDRKKIEENGVLILSLKGSIAGRLRA